MILTVSSVKDLPHIREHLDDPAVKVLADQAVQHLRTFVEASHFQLASTYNPVKLANLARLILSVKVRMALRISNPQALTTLLLALGYSSADTLSVLVDPTRAVELETRLKSLRSADRWDAAKSVETVLRSIGNALNARERAWIREAWVDAGGMESQGRAYALLANFSESLIENVSNDEEAPAALKAILATVPRGEQLDERIAVASDNIRGAIWSAHGVLRDGWMAVSRHLESMIAKRYGDLGQIRVDTAQNRSTVFLKQSSEPDGEKFIDSRVHFVRDGEEFFQQIVKLLEDSERAFVGESAETEAVIALNYWAIESSWDLKSGQPNVWGLRIAERLKDLAMQGFFISIVVDEKNGPSRLGRRRLTEIADEVKKRGTGRFEVHPWTPSDDQFPLSSHVKYLVTPIGVIAGGSNIGDHYAHWADTNMLLSGTQTVECFWQIHRDVLREQKEVGRLVPQLPELKAMDPDGWIPLVRYDRDQQQVDVYDPDWQKVRLRIFRDQGGDANDRILVEMITALDAARGLQPPDVEAEHEDQPCAPDTVYIANAYFVLTQPIDHHPVARAIKRAVERGVNVEIMTNSADSCDEPAVAGPIIKSAFLILAMARDVRKTAAADQASGLLTIHLPDREFIGKDEHNVPRITIHDKTMFFGNMAFVTTHNLHPRSFTLEQELLTELVGTPKPAKGATHTEFMTAARRFLEDLKTQPGGGRITDIDKLLAPIDWDGETRPNLWDTAARLYLLWLEKQYLYCHTFTSKNDEEVRQVEAKLDESTRTSLADLLMNIF